MKTRIANLTLLSLAALGTALSAQTQDQSAPQATVKVHQPADPQKQLNHLTKKLALTSDQQNQILPILTDRQQQVTGIENDNSLTPKQRHAKLIAVRSDSESRLRNALTDQQRASYDQMKQEERDRAKARKTASTPAN